MARIPDKWAIPILGAAFQYIEDFLHDTGDVKYSIKAGDHGRWVLCDGRSAAQWPELDQALLQAGSPFGNTGGHPLLPAQADRVLVGASGTHALGATFGQQAPTMPGHSTGNDTPDHTHQYIYDDICCTIDGGSTANVSTTFGVNATSGASTRHTHPVSGVGSATDGNYPPAIAMNLFMHT